MYPPTPDSNHLSEGEAESLKSGKGMPQLKSKTRKIHHDTNSIHEHGHKRNQTLIKHEHHHF